MKQSGAKKSNVMIGLIYIIIFGVFNLLVFTIFKTHTKVFWISYCFAALAFVVQIASMFLAFESRDIEAVFFGIPLASLSLYYLFAAVFVAVVFMVFQSASVTLATVIQVLVLAAFLVVAILSLLGREAVQTQNEAIKESVTGIRVMCSRVETWMNNATDPALRTALKNLHETIRYSDPMSNPAVADVEAEINGALNELRLLCEDDPAAAAAKCKQIERLFMERNSMLKAVK